MLRDVGPRLRARAAASRRPGRRRRLRDATRTAGAERRARPDAWSACPRSSAAPCSERSTVTSVLISEALAHGDMGIAVACLAPAAVRTALSLWGDADQQATYLPAFVGENVPAAALAVLEPRPLFDPFALRDARAPRRRRLRARRRQGARAAARPTAELFIVAAELEDGGPALFVVESRTAGGISVEPEPAMGIRAAATGRLIAREREAAAGRAARRAARRACTPTASRSAGWAGARWPSAPPRPCSTT